MVLKDSRWFVVVGWLLLVLSSVLGLGSAAYFVFFPAPADLQGVVNLTGRSWPEIVSQSPSAAALARYYISMSWIADAAVYAVGLVLALTAFRKGQRWAWYLWWIVVLYGVAFIIASALAGGTMWANWIVHLSLELLGLLLPLRMFLPKTTVTRSHLAEPAL